MNFDFPKVKSSQNEKLLDHSGVALMDISSSQTFC